MVVFGQRECNRAKMLYSGKSGIWARAVEFGQSGCILANVVVFGQGGCILAKWLYSSKSG